MLTLGITLIKLEKIHHYLHPNFASTDGDMLLCINDSEHAIL